LTSPEQTPRVVAIIPARGGSKRLPRKNIREIMGKPLLAWVIDALAESAYLGIDDVYISTDDDEIAEIATRHGASVVKRPPELAEDAVWTEPVIQHGVLQVEEATGKPVGIALWMNASIPEIQTTDIDSAIVKLLNDGLAEVMSVDAHDNCTSAVRVLRRTTLFQQRLSVNCGVIRLPYIDIHDETDLETVAKRLEARHG
jgi:N-acylneuraminate cytidylyltransferase